MENTCFFIGHASAPEDLLPILEEAVERHITQYAVTDFFVGQYGHFDALAARAVKNVKQRHPSVTLTLLLPYHPAERPVETPKGFDDTFYPPLEGVPRRFAIPRANRFMTDHCTHLICYVRLSFGNSSELLTHARAREKRGLLHIENLAQ